MVVDLFLLYLKLVVALTVTTGETLLRGITTPDGSEGDYVGALEEWGIRSLRLTDSPSYRVLRGRPVLSLAGNDFDPREAARAPLDLRRQADREPLAVGECPGTAAAAVHRSGHTLTDSDDFAVGFAEHPNSGLPEGAHSEKRLEYLRLLPRDLFRENAAVVSRAVSLAGGLLGSHDPARSLGSR